MSTRSILIVEEDAATRTFLAGNLTADGYQVAVAGTGANALSLLAARRPHLVIADINGQTLGLLDAIRDGGGLAADVDPETPMIVLTRRADELARVRVFDRGGDDVITKPFCYPELRGRVRALLRRTYEPPAHRVLRVGALRVDTVARDVVLNGRRVELSAREFALLAQLASDPTRVFTRAELLHDVWGYRSPVRTRTVDSHAARLRHKLARHGDQRWVSNVWGVGYCLVRGSDVRNEAA